MMMMIVTTDISLLYSHFFLTRELTAFFVSMGLGQGCDSSGRGVVFSIFFKALNIELKTQKSLLKVQDSMSGFRCQRLGDNGG